METFKLDQNGDLVIMNGELQMVEEYDELRQAIWLILSINKNEWFLDNELGLNYDVFMQDKFYDKNKIARAIEEAILQNDRITYAEVTKIELDKLTRRINIEAYVTDNEGAKTRISEVINIE